MRNIKTSARRLMRDQPEHRSTHAVARFVQRLAGFWQVFAVIHCLDLVFLRVYKPFFSSPSPRGFQIVHFA